jgi:hypothetical protein
LKPFTFLIAIYLLLIQQSCWNSNDTRLAESANESSLLIQQAATLLETGDLILRTGRDFSSEQVRDLSKTEKIYSHGGIVYRDSGKCFVYHVEPDYYHIKDKVRKEVIDSFLNPEHNLGFAVGRYTLDSNEKKELITYLEEQFSKKTPFDMDFSLETDDQLYCSEMIRKGLYRASSGRILIQADKLDDRTKYKLIKHYFKLPEQRFANREVIAIDQLYLNPHCRILKRFKFAP